MVAFYQTGDSTGIEKYFEEALARVWKAQRLSQWMTTMLHTIGLTGLAAVCYLRAAQHTHSIETTSRSPETRRPG